jgi:hypothetical protein
VSPTEQVLATAVGAGAAIYCTLLGFLLGWERRDNKAAITEDRWIAAVAKARQERDDTQAALTALLEETDEWRSEAQHASKSSSPSDA